MTFKSSADRLLRHLLGVKELIIVAHDLRPRKGVLHLWVKQLGIDEKFLKRWSKSAKLSRFEPLRRFARTIDRHWGAVMASQSGITNAAAEGINRLIRMARNHASGCRSPGNFANMIYLIAGDLDLPGQIAPKNRPRQTKQLAHQELCL